MRLLVTGASGFSGQFLCKRLLEEGDEVIGLARPNQLGSPGENTGPQASLIACDLLGRTEIKSIVSAVRPDGLLHLAGAVGNAPPNDLYQSNVLGTLNVLEAVSGADHRMRVLIAGSSAQYAPPTDPAQVLQEEHPQRPLSHYGVSKLAQESVAVYYRDYRGLDIIITRPFNFTGPGEPPDRVCSSLARQVAGIKLKIRPKTMEVGNLDTLRDFTDVRDVARAYSMLIKSAPPGTVVNICSAEWRSIRSVLNDLLQMAGVEPRVVVDPARLVKNDLPRQRGSFDRLHRLTGWRPEIPFSQTLRDLLYGWEERLKLESPVAGDVS